MKKKSLEMWEHRADPVSSVPAIFHVPWVSSDNDPCLFNRICVCLFLAGTSASTTCYLCNNPGLDKRWSPLPTPYWICLFVSGLSYRVPNLFSKACYSASQSPSRAFGSYVSTYITHISCNIMSSTDGTYTCDIPKADKAVDGYWVVHHLRKPQKLYC